MILRSLSARRAWIEIQALQNTRMDVLRSLSARRAWIEMITPLYTIAITRGSLSARRAWIEIWSLSTRMAPFRRVALRKESVDRNRVLALAALEALGSLSARRAWIEMPEDSQPSKRCAVALRKESVDRNLAGRHLIDLGQKVALRKESVDRNTLRCRIGA